ncbi:MAG: dihydrodipicolinate synthase family protein, partial [Bacteroidales bacterium]|nr:dihydrodipicolinate synthase family protein [Bacteroidales bacterium]
MKIPELKGCGTALLTPFLEDGEVDYEAFAALVQRQAEGGVDFLVPLGTTAETPT